MQTERLKRSPNRYTVLIAGEEVGEVWNWHGSWSVRSSGQRVHGLKSRKQAIKQVEQMYQRRS